MPHDIVNLCYIKQTRDFHAEALSKTRLPCITIAARSIILRIPLPNIFTPAQLTSRQVREQELPNEYKFRLLPTTCFTSAGVAKRLRGTDVGLLLL
jgi:transcriptional regulatory protein LevR